MAMIFPGMDPYLENPAVFPGIHMDRESGMRVVTMIELVSPSNKYAGPGRERYTAKQQEVLQSDAHLIEIDLLRYGPHVLAVPESLVAGRFKYDYLISVSRASGRRNRFEVYPRTVRQPLPWIRVPLAGDDPDVQLNIRPALEQAYEAGSYRDRIHYHAPCEPPLEPEDQAWADELLRTSGKGAGPS